MIARSFEGARAIKRQKEGQLVELRTPDTSGDEDDDMTCRPGGHDMVTWNGNGGVYGDVGVSVVQDHSW